MLVLNICVTKGVVTTCGVAFCGLLVLCNSWLLRYFQCVSLRKNYSLLWI